MNVHEMMLAALVDAENALHGYVDELEKQGGTMFYGHSVLARVRAAIDAAKKEGEKKKPRALSCGCCTGGCVCWNHQDTPNGRPIHVCEYHQTTPHPRITEAP